MTPKMIAFENQKLQVLSEEKDELKLQAPLVSLEEEFERAMREINSAIINAEEHFQLQTLSKEELKLQALSKEELKLQAKELKLQTLLKKILG